MKAFGLASLIIAALPMTAFPAIAADLPDSRPARATVYGARVYVPTYCRLATERYFDGYGWRTRDIQVCR